MITRSPRASYKGLLTRRFALLWAAAFVIIGLAARISIHAILVRQVDRSLSLIASLQAAAVAESPPGRMQLREWELRDDEALPLRSVLWQIQVWNEDDEVMLTSGNVTDTLPEPRAGLDHVRQGEILYETRPRREPPLRQIFYPLQRLDPGHAGHVIQVAVSLDPLQRTLARIDLVLILVGVTGVGLAVAFTWSTASRAMRPVFTIVERVRSIQFPSRENRITAFAGTAEFHDLVDVLNDMLDRLHRAYEAQQRFTADASHELRSPLTATKGLLEVALRRERNPAEYRETMQDVLEEVERMQALVNDLLVLARQDAGALKLHRRGISLSDLVEGAVHTLRESARRGEVQISAEIRPVTLQGDENMLRRVIINLLDNAIRHAPHGSTVFIEGVPAGDRIRLAVEDEGPGVPAEMRHNVFERFYRADDARTSGEGAGLGLALCRAIVEAHGGSIRVVDGRVGARFEAELPLNPPEAPSAAPHTPAS